MRINLFEFEDLDWFPGIIRSGGTDYLRHFLTAAHFYEPAVPLIGEALRKTGESRIVDLCSGGGGAIAQMQHSLQEHCGRPVAITLSDKFPNTEAFDYLHKQSGGRINFSSIPVDAAGVPEQLQGFRTMFTAVHHFSPGAVKAVLRDAAEKGAGIALFDGGDKTIFTLLGMLLFHPFAFLLCTPFFRPFKFSRLFFTYVLPLIPLYTVWDGIASVFRLYRHEELLQLAEEIKAEDYTWRSGKIRNRWGFTVIYLVGYPERKNKPGPGAAEK